MADHYELLSRRRTRRMTTNAGTYSWGPLSEDNDVLARQDLNGLDPIERERGHLFFHLQLCHLVEGFDGHGWIFTPILDEYHATIRLNRPANRFHDLGRKVEFVIHIHHEDQVHRCGGKLGVVGASQDGHDVS